MYFSQLRCEENDDDESCTSSVFDDESGHYEDLDDGVDQSACSDIDAPEPISKPRAKIGQLNSKPNKHMYLEDYLALESCYDICDPSYIALETQNNNKPPGKPQKLPRLLNYARMPGYFYHNIRRELMDKIGESKKEITSADNAKKSEDGTRNSNPKPNSVTNVELEKTVQEIDTTRIEMTPM